MVPPRPVRVAHVAPQLDTGGLERLLVEFARHADPGRFELRFVSLGTRGAVADDIERCGWPVTAVGAGPGLRPGLVGRLAGLFRRWGIDVVHTHNTRPLLYAPPAARLAGVRGVVHTRHGQKCPPARRLGRAAVRAVSRLVDRFVCVSDDAARLTAGEGAAAGKVCTIWNGIDLAKFADAGPRPDGPAVFVGRLSPEKDVVTLLRATAIVRAAEPSFRLEIAGDGPCRAALEGLAGELGLGDGVRFRGEVRDVPGLLARASMFILPSLTEGVSLAALEAMACGLPVVATRVGGNPEVVADGATGLLVPPADPARLAAALGAVWADPARARRMGGAGRRRVERFFDIRRMVGCYEALYLDVLRHRPLAAVAAAVSCASC